MVMLPREPVAPDVTSLTIVERLSEEYPVIEILPSAPVAPEVTFSIMPLRLSDE